MKVRPDGKSNGRQSERWIMEMIDWLKDDGRPGKFGLRLDDIAFGFSAPIWFAFSDPDTAFEFKMRWG